MIDLDKKSLKNVTSILRKYVPDCEVWAFGSRVSGTAKQFSDLDLVLKGKDKVDWRCLEMLKDAFAESDLPIMVDVLDWRSAPAKFHEIISQNSIRIL